MRHTIIGIHVPNRVEKVPTVQSILTKYGCSIRTRLGIHDVEGTVCAPNGLIIIDAIGDDIENLVGELKSLPGVDVQRMDFDL